MSGSDSGTTRISPAGSNQGSSIRASRSARVIRPCSAWCAKAAAFTRNHSSSSRPGRNVRATRPSGRTGSSSGRPRRTAGPARTAHGPPRALGRRRTARRPRRPRGPTPASRRAPGPEGRNPRRSDDVRAPPPARPTPRPPGGTPRGRRPHTRAGARRRDRSARGRRGGTARTAGERRRSSSAAATRARTAPCWSAFNSAVRTGSLGHAEIPPRAAFTMPGRKFMKSQPDHRAYHPVLGLACTVPEVLLSTDSATMSAQPGRTMSFASPRRLRSRLLGGSLAAPALTGIAATSGTSEAANGPTHGHPDPVVQRLPRQPRAAEPARAVASSSTTRSTSRHRPSTSPTETLSPPSARRGRVPRDPPASRPARATRTPSPSPRVTSSAPRRCCRPPSTTSRPSRR